MLTPEPLKPKLVDPIRKILEETGLTTPSGGELSDILERHNLGPEDTLKALSEMMNYGETESIKLQAVKLSLEINKLLKPDVGPVAPVFNVIIKDSQVGINPILLPRELHDSIGN
jgi:hypothetical protein